MNVQTYPDAEAVAKAAAAWLAAEAEAAVAARGKFLIAVSGGTTPWVMLRELAKLPLPWDRVHLFQVDERLAPTGHDDRNLTQLMRSLAGLPAKLHAMPVEDADFCEAAAAYEHTLRQYAGMPAVLDVVHLGLGADGHTASLVPGDAVLDVTGRDVALTGVYQGRRRMTLTFECLDRARKRLWLVTGAAKKEMLVRLRAADAAIPAGRVSQAEATVLADEGAAG